MIVYVESNFILEYALLQEQYVSCDRIIKVAESGQARLVVPAFCIGETLTKISRNAEDRLQLSVDLGRQLRLLQRTQTYREQATLFQGELARFLLLSSQEENSRLYEAFERIMKTAELAPLDPEPLAEAFGFQVEKRLRLPDATVLASIVHHLRSAPPGVRCFVSRDKHFDNPHVKAALEEENCKVIRNFDDAHSFIVNRLGQ